MREAWRGGYFFPKPFCPKCGAHKNESQRVIARWNTNKITVWNPLTWNNGYWEEKT